MTTFLALVFSAVAVLLVLVVLVQRGRGGGLSGAFGSGGGSSSAFGTKTGDVFTTTTVVLFVVFMLLAVWLNFRFRDHKETIAGALAPATAASQPALPDNLNFGPAGTPLQTPTTLPVPSAPITPAPSTSQPR